jgi:hypothetical protein
MKTITKAKPNRNGNTRSHFIEAYSALRKAQDAISQARSVVSENVTNGRNYVNVDDCLAERRATDDIFMKAFASIGYLMSDISDIVGDSE